MLNYFKSIFLKIIRLIIRFLLYVVIKQNKKRIVFVQESFSGSNVYALWKYSKDELSKEYDLILFKEDNLNNSIIKYFQKYKLFYSAKLILTTHASYKPTKNHIHFQLWHGGTTKRANIELNKSNGLVSKSWKNVDYILSYSELSSTFLNSIMLTNLNKYIVTGAPRNDFLFINNSRQILQNIFSNVAFNNKKVLFYLPTYRDFYGIKLGDKAYDNPFGFNDFNILHFSQYLEKNNLIIIIKIHPHEEVLLEKYLNHYTSNNILVLKDSLLEENKIDLYELLASSNGLITDYSSVYYDYLLLNKPVIFIPIDIESFKFNWGFLIENYDEWFVGEKVYNYNDFLNTINSVIINGENDELNFKRSIMKLHHHRFKDGDSCKRVSNFIKTII